MKFCAIVITLLCAGICCGTALGADNADNSFFKNSLHYNVQGMNYWYSKANGGLESLTGTGFTEAGCASCHVSSCDTCHKTAGGDQLSYANKAASNPDICLKCHARMGAVLKTDKAANQLDVHLARGMVCKDCHTAKEMHGNGIRYTSMKQPGAMDASCDKCHTAVKPTRSHTVHGGKLECKACHERHVVSCTNCHFETMTKEKKRVSRPVSGWVFLMNYEGKVTSANTQTFVAPGNKTFLLFAPNHSHSVQKQGRACNDCHASEMVKQVQKGKARLTWMQDGKVVNVPAVIPVVDGVDYDFAYENYKDGQWIPIQDAPKPMLQYVGFGAPLSKEQLSRLAKPMK